MLFESMLITVSELRVLSPHFIVIYCVLYRPSLDAVRTAREWCRVQVVLEVPLNGVQPSDIPYGLRKMVLSSTRQGTCIRTSIHHAHQLIHSQLSEVVFSG